MSTHRSTAALSRALVRRALTALAFASIATGAACSGDPDEPAAADVPRLTLPSFSPRVPGRFVTASLPRLTVESRDPRDVAVALAKQQYGLAEDEIVVKSFVPSGNGLNHVYLRQLHQGIEISNADMNVSIDSHGAIVSYGSSFVRLDQPPQALAARRWHLPMRAARPTDAFRTLAAHLRRPTAANSDRELRDGSTDLRGIPYAEGAVRVVKSYLHDGSGQLIPTYRMELKTEDGWYEAHVDADGTKVVALNDWVADSGYKVFPYNVRRYPDQTTRRLVKDPEDKLASPNGWHDQGDKKFTTTIGNNVFAQENWKAFGDWTDNHRPDGGADHDFDFPFDLAETDPKAYIDASVTNLFYMNNALHDLFYRYGFDEVAGNFQQNNWGKGGRDKDAVIAHAQDGRGTNNSNFATPPDGQPGRMRVYIFTLTTPKRDGDMANEIITHEYAHGLSNRLTGGPDNVNCLGQGEAAGMGEGWSDFFSVALRLRENDDSKKDVGVGGWVLGDDEKTARKFLYSTNMTTNPTTYGYLNRPAWRQMHATGEIWANILYQMYWNLMKATGKYNLDWYSADKTAGNTLALQIVIDGMKFQPCNPTFVSARDAILNAEEVATGGQYKCAVWKAFAKRGVGANAASGASVTADFTLPPGC